MRLHSRDRLHGSKPASPGWLLCCVRTCAPDRVTSSSSRSMCVLLRSGCCAIAAALLLSSLLHTSCCLSVPILISTTTKKESNVFCIHDGFCIFVSCMLPRFYLPCFLLCQPNPLIFYVSHVMRVHQTFVRQPFSGHCPLYRISVASLCIVDLSSFSCRRASFAVGFHGP